MNASAREGKQANWHTTRSKGRPDAGAVCAIPAHMKVGRHEMKRSATLSLFTYWDEIRSARGPRGAESAPGCGRCSPARSSSKRTGAGSIPCGCWARFEEIAPNARLGASFLECWDPHSRLDLEALLPAVHDDERPWCSEPSAKFPAASPCRGSAASAAGDGPDGKPRVLGGMAADRRRPARPPQRLELVSARTVDVRDWPRPRRARPALPPPPILMAACA